MKAHAIRGLKEKGLDVRGRGNTAKFSFDRGKWDSWVRTRPRHERARTVGRSKTVTAKPGMQIHQECRERGCGRLCEPEKIVSIDSIGSEPNRKPVSNSPPPESPPEKPQPQPEPVKPQPSSAVTVQPQVTAQLQQLLGIFLSLGVEICQSDIMRCEKAWRKLNPEERSTAMAYALARHAGDWSAWAKQFIPRPWNYLEGKQW
ncbi:MAG: hypothetical protein WAN65_31720, partial [Candidatus Sulfotelmatobacter sp.]